MTTHDPHALVERLKELDHAHRSRAGRGRLRSGLGLALSLRFLRSAFAQWTRPPRMARPTRVTPPPPGEMKVTLVGHATVMITSEKNRILTDPCFATSLWGLRRAQAPCLDDVDRAATTLVLISHAHRDHLHRPSLAQLPRTATVVVPRGCADLVAPLGFARVVELEPGDDFDAQDLLVTAVAARHPGRRGAFDWKWRASLGYLIRSPSVSVLFAGDTGYFSGFADIGRLVRPDVALLPIAGYEPLALRETHMSPLDALAAFEDLGAELLVPIAHGAFPLGYEPLDAPLAWLRELCQERGLEKRLAALGPGETCRVRRPGAVA